MSIFAVFLFASAVCGQTANRVKIAITSTRPALAHVTVELKSPQTSLSFRNAYGSVVGLAERIEKVLIFTSQDLAVPTTKIAAGQYRAANEFMRVEYDVALNLPVKQADRSHVSWLTQEHGVLMLADLLPEIIPAVMLQVELILPPSWTVASSLRGSAGSYLVPAPDKAVFLIGGALQLKTKDARGARFLVASSGSLPFNAGEIMKTATRVIEECARITGTGVAADSVLMVLPSNGAAFSWTAETRGNSILVLLSTAEPKRRLLARLGVILTHEAFHLWVPNALQLSGDYDWFFEGFTLYQALVTALHLRLIDFDEYLNTVARVYDSYLLAADRDRWSLLELSERRWTSTSSLIYNKGMLVAMIYDLRLRQNTGGKRGLIDLYRQLFEPGEMGRDANEVIIALLDHLTGMSGFSSTFVSKPRPLDLQFLLSPYGINVERSGFETRFVISKPLQHSQEKLLRSIGYRK